MSNLKLTENSVIDLLAEILNASVDRGSSSSSILQWDSLAQMKIIIKLEKSFGVEIEDEVIADLDSVEKIFLYLQKKI